MSQVTYSNVAITKVLLLRGNTIQNARYLGLPGEPTIDLEAKTLRIHDGVTVGGHEIESTANLSSYSGNIIPSANLTYSLGTITHQWKDLFVSNNTIYMGGIPLSINANGNLTVNGNVIQGGGGANVTNNGYNIGVDSTGALLLAGNGVVRGPNGGNGPVNLVSSNFVQMQWTANANVADPNSSGGVINWAYVDDAGFHVENVSGEYDRVWNFGIDGITQVPESITSYSNTLKLAGSVGDLTADKYLQIRPGATDNHIHFDTGDNSTYDLFVGDDSKYVNVSHDGNVYVGTNGNTKIWNFNTDGTITLPGAIKFNTTGQQLYTSGTGNNDNFILFTANIQNDINGIQIGEVNQGATIYTSGAVQLYANTAGTAALWAFNTDGTTTFPDSTVQTTAFSNAAVSSYLADTTLKTFGDSVTITGNLTVQGNIIFNGNATLVSTNNLIINDNIIYIANANPGSSLDIGIAGHFTSTRYQHTGLVRQASTNQWQLFSNVVPEPGGTIDFTNAVYDDIRVGNITSPTIIGINANVATANVGIKGYVDLANTIQSAQLTAANTAWAANASAQQTLISSLQSNAASQETEIQSLFANSYQQQALIGNLQASAYSNINVAAYLTSVGIGGGNYSNINVAAYLAGSITTGNISTGNITAGNISANGTVTGSAFKYANGVSILSGVSYLAGVASLDDTGQYPIIVFKSSANQLVTASGNAGSVPTYQPHTGGMNAWTFSAQSTTGNGVTSQSSISATGNIYAIGNVIAGGNVNATYFVGNGAFLTGIAASSNYSNVQVATYLQVGNIANVSVAGNVTATYFVGNGSQLTGIPAGYSNVQTAAYLNATGYNLYSNVNVAAYLAGTSYTNYSNVNTAAYTQTMGYTNYSNVNVAAYLSSQGIGGGNYSNINVKAYTETIGLTNYSNVNTAAYTQTMGYTNYSNVNVAAYIPTHTGNVGVNNLIGTTPNVTLVANSYSTTYDIYGNVAFGNALYPVQVYATGNISTSGYLFGNGAFLTGIVTSGGGGSSNYSNVNVKAYTETIGLTNYSNVNAKAYTETMGFQNFGNVNVAAFTSGLTNYSNVNVTSYLAGNITVGNIVGAQPNVYVQAGAYTSVFDNSGNVTVPALFTAGNIQTAGYLFGNGAFLTGITTASGNYSNVDVANYLPTYSGNVANIRLGVSGVLTFADGTTQTTAGGYSNVNVTTFLANSSAVFIGNTANVATVYPLQSNSSQLFVGLQTGLASGNSSVTTNTWLLNNLYFNSAGNLTVRNTQATGYNYVYMGGAGIMLGGLNSAATANANVGVLAPWATISSTGISTTVGLTTTGTMAVNSATGITTNQGTFLLANASATTINFGGAAGTITMGTVNSTVFVGNAIANSYKALSLRASGTWLTAIYGTSSGGYNSPPYNNVATTGGSGAGMTVNVTGVVGGYPSGITIVNPGIGYKNGDLVTATGGATFTLVNYSSVNTGSSAANYTFDIDGNLSVPGNLITTGSLYIANISSANYITANTIVTAGGWGNITQVAYLTANVITATMDFFGDFSNANVNARTVFMTSAANATTGIYAAPSGSSTGASWQAANSGNLINASKIMITTNGSTDVQLVSGINGTGTYLPLSFYNNGAAQMQLTVSGNLNMTVNNSISTSGTGYFLGNSVGTTAAYTGNVTAGGVVATQYGNSFGTTATYTGNIYAANFFGNITSGSTGNLNVVGNLISTGYGFFPGAYNEQATTSGVFIGNTGSGTPSPRIGFYNGNVSQNWQVDNYFGQFRWFTPGITQMNLDSTGSLTVTGNVTVNGTGGVAMPLRPAFRVYGQGGSIGLNANLTATNWTVDYTQGNSAAYLNGTNGTFTAPVAGLYQTSLTARTTSNTNASGIQAVIQQIKSGSKTVAMMIEWGTNTTFNHATGSTTVKLAVGDKLVVQCISDGGTGGFSFDGNDHWDVVYLG